MSVRGVTANLRCFFCPRRFVFPSIVLLCLPSQHPREGSQDRQARGEASAVVERAREQETGAVDVRCTASAHPHPSCADCDAAAMPPRVFFPFSSISLVLVCWHASGCRQQPAKGEAGWLLRDLMVDGLFVPQVWLFGDRRGGKGGERFCGRAPARIQPQALPSHPPRKDPEMNGSNVVAFAARRSCRKDTSDSERLGIDARPTLLVSCSKLVGKCKGPNFLLLTGGDGVGCWKGIGAGTAQNEAERKCVQASVIPTCSESVVHSLPRLLRWCVFVRVRVQCLWMASVIYADRKEIRSLQ